MERRRHLYKPLQECLLRLRRPQPYALPHLMCGKELARLVEPQAFRKRSLAPIEFHDLQPKVQPSMRLTRASPPPGVSAGNAVIVSARWKRVYTVRQHRSRTGSYLCGSVD